MNKHHELVIHKHTCKLPKSSVSEDSAYQWWAIKGSGRQWKASFCKLKIVLINIAQLKTVEDNGKPFYIKYFSSHTVAVFF